MGSKNFPVLGHPKTAEDCDEICKGDAGCEHGEHPRHPRLAPRTSGAHGQHPAAQRNAGAPARRCPCHIARCPNHGGRVETSCGYGCMVADGSAQWTPPNFNKYATSRHGAGAKRNDSVMGGGFQNWFYMM